VTHPQPRVYGTYTGRVTYSSKQKAKGVNAKGKEVNVERPTGVPIHQFPRDKRFRAQIVPPEGYTIVEFDFAGQEFRWMAVMSEDERMLSLCAPGEDAHGYMGSVIGGKDYRTLVAAVKQEEKEAKQLRQLGKVANLSLQYRTSAPKLRSVARVQYNIPMMLEEATEIHAAYQQAYPDVPSYWQSQIIKCRSLGYAETIAGRQVQLNGSWSGRQAWALQSTAINFPIQGAGADQKYLALAVARNELAKFDAHVYFELHDGIYFIVPDKRVEAFIPRFHKLLSNLPYKRAWGVDLPIQFPVDGKVGPSWGELKEITS